MAQESEQDRYGTTYAGHGSEEFRTDIGVTENQATAASGFLQQLQAQLLMGNNQVLRHQEEMYNARQRARDRQDDQASRAAENARSHDKNVDAHNQATVSAGTDNMVNLPEEGALFASMLRTIEQSGVQRDLTLATIFESVGKLLKEQGKE